MNIKQNSNKYLRKSLGKEKYFLRKLCASFMAILVVVSAVPVPQANAESISPRKVAHPPNSKGKIRMGPHRLAPINTQRKFSAYPTDLEISTARVFLEPLIPMNGTAVSGENVALASAIDAFKKRKSTDDVSEFSKFITSYPNSRWRASIELNIGKNRFANGYFTQALTSWKSAWELSKGEKARLQRDVADAAVSELLLLNARLGRMTELKKYFAEIEKRPILGSNEERVKSAREGFKRMSEKPSEAFKCGPFSVDSLLYRNEKSAVRSDAIEKATSTVNGTNLLQVSELAKAAGLKLQPAKRSMGAPFVPGSIIHFKLDHFAAITAERNGLYQIKDPTFGDAGSTWLTFKALEAETDGFALIPEGPQPTGWTKIQKDDAAKVWGKGGATGFDGNIPRCLLGPAQPSPATLGLPGVPMPPQFFLNEQLQENDGDGPKCLNWGDCGFLGPPLTPSTGNHECDCKEWEEEKCGMAVSGVRKEENTLNIVDTPLIYSPPIGPPIAFELNYAWLETNQPSTYSFTNWGPNWTSRWVSYLTVDPTTQAITLRRPSGGSEVYTKDPSTGLYPPNFLSHDTMVSLGGGAYQSTSVEGWVVKYTLADSSSPPRIFMTEWKDPSGNSALIQYDADFRITTITDAISQVTTFSYVSNTLGNSGFYKVATITDPVSRTAQFEYDSSNTNLLSITDAVGMKSEFIYDPASSFISAMTTPYGTFSYNNYTPPDSNGLIARGLRTTFPDGSSTVSETWIPHINKTFYWGRNQTKLYPNDPANRDYSHCKVTKWCYDAGTNLLEPVLYSKQSPAENPTFYKYSGQVAQDFLGSSNRPMQVYQSIGNQLVLATIGGAKTSGDTLNITVYDSALPGGNQSINYVVQSGDNLNSITAGLASAMNSNSNLKNLGVRATSSLTTIGLTSMSANSTIYTKSTSGGATETLTLSAGTKQAALVSLGGSAVSGETVAIWIQVSGGWTYNSYVIQPGDTLANVATALAAVITGNSTMLANEISATASGTSIDITGLQTNLIQLAPAGSANATLVTKYLTNGTFNFGYREYNDYGLVTKTVDSQGRTIKYVYDPTNKVDLLEVREVQGTDNYLLDYFEYNSAHQVTKHIDGSGQQTVMTYNAQGQLLTKTDALGSVTTNSYTGNFLTSIDGPLPGSADVSTISYDSVGRVYQTVNSEGYTLQFSYDDLNRPTETLFPDGTTTKIIYDRLDTVLSKDRLDRWTQSASDNMGRVKYTVDPAGRKTQFEWCTCGALAALIDPKGQKTTWHHDLSGRTLEKVYADGTKVTFAYDPYSGRLLSKTDAENQTAFFTYFADGSTFQTEYIDAKNPTSTVSTFYDQKFNRVSSVQSDWGITSYTYNNYITNPAGTPVTGGGALQLIHNNVIPNSDITFQYDALGRVTNRDINSTANASSWTFDAISRVTSETNALGTFNYAYVDDVSGSSKGLSRLASVSYPNGQSSIFDWYGNSDDNHLRGITHMAPGNVPRSQFNYSHNSGGEIIRWAQQNAGMTPQVSSLGYDKISQLTASVAGDGSASSPYSNQYFYGYDPASNRTGVQSVTVETARIGGSVTAGDTLTLTVKNETLSGGQKSINYVVQSGNSLNDIAAQLAAAICADTDMQSIGVNACSTLSIISLKSVSASVTSFSQSTSGGSTETITLGVSRNAVQNLTISGTVTTGDVITLTSYDAALSGGNKSASYTVVGGNTLSNIASGLAAAINADAALTSAGITATSASTSVNIRSTSTNLTTYRGSLNSGATEHVSLAMNMNGAETIVIGGSKTTGDSLSLNVYDKGLSGGKRSISYTALSGDNLSTITSALASAINADSQLQAIGVSAIASGTLLSVNSASVHVTTYTTERSSGATETITPGVNPNGIQTAVIGGTKTTGNVLTITVFDSGLSGGSKAANYTVLAGDNLVSIAAGIAAVINSDAALTAIGVTANSVNTVINIKSTSIHSTTYSQSVSPGATETILLATGIGVTQSAHNNVNQVTNISAGGATRFAGTTNKAIKSAAVATQAIKISATAKSLSSFSTSLNGIQHGTATFDISKQRENGQTTLLLTGTPTPGDIFNLTVTNPNLPGGQQTVLYKVKAGDVLGSIAYGLSLAISANQYLYASNFGGIVSGNDLIIQSPFFYNTATTYSCSIVGKTTETLTLSSNQNGNASVTVGGTATIGDVVSVIVANSGLPGGSQTISRTVQSGDTTSSIASALAASLNSNSNLSNIGMTASSASSVVSIATAGTTYSSSTSGGATETLTVGFNSEGNTVAVVGGIKTTGDVLTLTINDSSLPAGSVAVAYTVLSGDNLESIAAGLSTAINANSNLQGLGVTASSAAAADFAWSTYFTANPVLPSGTSTAAISATDGANNTKTDLHLNHVNTPSSQTLTFDLNGNMISDGTNTYKWDAANRLIEIDYPGSNNYTVFTFGPTGERAKIVETTGGSVTSTKQFIGGEERDAGGSVTRQFFKRGEVISGTAYFYVKDHLGSIRELTDSSGAIQTKYEFDAYGRAEKQGSLDADFQFAGLYTHVRSGLYLTPARQYNSGLGVWLSRDPMESDSNLYTYAANSPVIAFDPFGLDVYLINQPSAVSGAGHNAVLLQDPNDQSKWWFFSYGPTHGALPIDQGGVDAKGRFSFEDVSNYAKSLGYTRFVAWHTCKNDDAKALNIASNWYQQPGTYIAQGGHNSNDFAVDVIRATGSQIIGGHSFPNSTFTVAAKSVGKKKPLPYATGGL